MTDQTQLSARLRAMMQLAENSTCCDCGDKHPTWASLIVPPRGSLHDRTTMGAFCCFHCSGAHRRLGVHICFVRSITLDDWKEKEVEAMEVGGNKRINKAFEAVKKTDTWSKPTPESDLDTRDEFIRTKYAKRTFFDPMQYMPGPPVPPPPVEEVQQKPRRAQRRSSMSAMTSSSWQPTSEFGQPANIDPEIFNGMSKVDFFSASKGDMFDSTPFSQEALHCSKMDLFVSKTNIDMLQSKNMNWSIHDEEKECYVSEDDKEEIVPLKPSSETRRRLKGGRALPVGSESGIKPPSRRQGARVRGDTACASPRSLVTNEDEIVAPLKDTATSSNTCRRRPHSQARSRTPTSSQERGHYRSATADKKPVIENGTRSRSKARDTEPASATRRSRSPSLVGGSGDRQRSPVRSSRRAQGATKPQVDKETKPLSMRRSRSSEEISGEEKRKPRRRASSRSSVDREEKPRRRSTSAHTLERAGDGEGQLKPRNRRRERESGSSDSDVEEDTKAASARTTSKSEAADGAVEAKTRSRKGTVGAPPRVLRRSRSAHSFREGDEEAQPKSHWRPRRSSRNHVSSTRHNTTLDGRQVPKPSNSSEADENSISHSDQHSHRSRQNNTLDTRSEHGMRRPSSAPSLEQFDLLDTKALERFNVFFPKNENGVRRAPRSSGRSYCNNSLSAQSSHGPKSTKETPPSISLRAGSEHNSRGLRRPSSSPTLDSLDSRSEHGKRRERGSSSRNHDRNGLSGQSSHGPRKPAEPAPPSSPLVARSEHHARGVSRPKSSPALDSLDSQIEHYVRRERRSSGRNNDRMVVSTKQPSKSPHLPPRSPQRTEKRGIRRPPSLKSLQDVRVAKSRSTARKESDLMSTLRNELFPTGRK